jgi:hypothetical protein
MEYEQSSSSSLLSESHRFGLNQPQQTEPTMAVRDEKLALPSSWIRQGIGANDKDDSTVVTASLGDSISSTRSFGKISELSILCVPSHVASLSSPFRPSISERRHVSFGDVQISVFAYTLGDNPCVSSGPPVTMERKAFETHCFLLDDYEKDKPEAREKDAMMMPRFYREELLRKQGFSRGKLREAVEEAQKIQKKRKLTWSAKASLKFQHRWKNLTSKKDKKAPEHYF